MKMNEWRIPKLDSANCLWYLCVVGIVAVGTASYNIPDELVRCYRGNATLPGPPHTVQLLLELVRKIERHNPTTLDMRLLSAELIHRLRIDGIENVPGVAETQWITPYSPRGLMVPKYTLLRQLVSQVPGTIEFDAFLTSTEICHLHRMLSSAVEPFQRDDERITCPQTLMSADGNPQAPWVTQNKVQKSNTNRTTFDRPISRCPLERGTCHTRDYGTIAPGIVIMSIAAGLQPQNVLISEFVTAYRKRNLYENLETMETADTRKQLERLFASLESIDNMYAAGLVGDLAEVCFYQGPTQVTNVSVGLAGAWNDTYLPRVRYLAENHGGRWEMTDSEILAGIDGHYLAHNVPQFVKRLRRLRLSQVLEMYYSERGIPVASIENIARRPRPTKRPTVREELRVGQYSDREPSGRGRTGTGGSRFRSVFDEEREEDQHAPEITRACQRREILRSIELDKLKLETYKFVELLQYATGSVIVSEPLMQQICDATVDRFYEQATLLLDTVSSCLTEDTADAETVRKPNVDLTVVLDGSRDEYMNLQLVSFLVELIDVSYYGSYISVVNGETGQYMVNRTNSVADAFEQLDRFRGSFPRQLSLSRSFAAIVENLARQTDTERASFMVGGNAPVILVFAQSHRVTTADFESAHRMLRGSFEQFADLYFAFITNDPANFRQLITFNDTFHSRSLEEHYRIIDSSRTTIASFENEIAAVVKSIPQRLVVADCRTTDNRDVWRDQLVREELEQYLTPGVELRYRLVNTFMHNGGDVRVQFMTTDYGEFTVCEARDWRATPTNCQTTGPGQESLWFNFTRPCGGGIEDPACRSIYFTVRMESTNMLCNENDCQFPDQVRFVLRHEGLRCRSDGSGAMASLDARLFGIFFTIATIFSMSWI
ncbi:uncharacterized protein LOC131206477 [Anopheles bellator]|uniref:uncharacterized protein LOC131206477 n=1 Tax=Anopheles bellator TaxID=139047 RepID=UPI0026484C22|nr:uncharacterized protein LOC131206477 [Anopheles bellator]